MEKLLDKLVEENRVLTKNGKVANYIPALKEANPENLGVAIVDLDGTVFCSGECDKKFTIQSISKTISLMLALLDNGEDKVFEKVGKEPTGDAFDSIIKLETMVPSRPLNPMINAGAIVIASMINGKNAEEKFERLLNFARRITNNSKLDINQEVYLSEKNAGNRNRSMAYFMKDVGIIEGDVEEVLDVYFKQCSMEVDCIDIANIGLFLANEGINPKTDEQIVTQHIARIVKTFMVTCGMYNASGEFAIEVGVPAKSGVGGGIMAAVPYRMGIGVYGPSLDEKGNSIGGYSILRSLSQELNLSIF